jgi:hypothetical protein
MAYIGRPIRVPVPFVRQQIGLGDAVKRITNAVGVQPCEPCKRRAAYLNRLIQFQGLKR